MSVPGVTRVPKEYHIDELTKPDHLRKLTTRTVETYPEDWIVVYELLQNAQDAIQTSDTDRGTVHIAMDLSEEKITVSDDGAGFPHDIYLLGLGGTDKDVSSPDTEWLNGKQGVGLKAVIYCTEYFRITSVINGKKWVAEAKNARTYLDGKDPPFAADTPEDVDEPNGTVVECTFPDGKLSRFVASLFRRYIDHIDDVLGQTVRSKLEKAIEYHFRTYAYAGCVNRLLGLSGPKEMQICVSISGITELDDFPRKVADILEHDGPLSCTFSNMHWDIADAVNTAPSGKWRPTVLSTHEAPERGDIARRTPDYLWTCKMTRSGEYVTLLRNKWLTNPIDVDGYADFFEQVSGIYIVVGSKTAFTKFNPGGPRQFLAATGIPSAHKLQPPARGADATYVTNNIHFVINLKADLNYGKQMITNTRLVGRASDFFKDAVRATLRNIAQNIVGAAVETGTADDVERITEGETDIIQRPDLGLTELSIRKEPADENLVIALFYELIGRGHIRDILTYSLHGRMTYDGRFVGKLSSQDEIPPPQTDNDLHNLEFKVHLADLIKDFEEGTKNPQNIQLVVVWDRRLRGKQHPDYQVNEIAQTAEEDRRFHRVQHVLKCNRTQRNIQLIVLKDLLKQLAQEQA